MKICWKLCSSYDEAKNFTNVIYLHEWDDVPFYWGKAHKSHFGGHKRKINGLHASGRYNSGYRHWIEGCLQHGGKLYIGQPDEEAKTILSEVENFLICTHRPKIKQREKRPFDSLVIEHVNDIPVCLKKTLDLS